MCEYCNKEEQISEEFELLIEYVGQALKKVDEDHIHLRKYFAERIAFEAAVWGGDTHYESIGILNEAIESYRQASKEIINEDED